MKILIALSWAAAGVSIIVLFVTLGAVAQKAERGTQHWTISVPSGPLVDYGSVHVFDMSGVCLYVYDGPRTGGITVISKAQLPAGAGCQ